MFGWLYRFLGSMLSFFERITGAYAIALVLYALIFKIVLLPFSIKQQKNQIAMAKLTPKIELIKAKYKGRTDQRTMQKQQQEIMELQQKEGYNPLSGCLPLLIQLPLIMLLYAVINNPISYIAKPNDMAGDKDMSTIAVEIYNEITPGDDKDIEKSKGMEITIINAINSYIIDKEGNFAGNPELDTIEKREAHIESYGLDLDTLPNFSLFGVNLANKPIEGGFSILWLIPVLAAAAQWVSMWLTRKFNGNAMTQPQDPQTKASMRMMDLMFPGMTLFMAFTFPGMLGLYWAFQALLGLLQSFILAKVMPLPKFTEEELKDMRKAQKEVEKAQREAAKSQPKYRSLHYIDDDDYEILPDAPGQDEKKDKRIDGDIPEIKD